MTAFVLQESGLGAEPWQLNWHCLNYIDVVVAGGPILSFHLDTERINI